MGISGARACQGACAKRRDESVAGVFQNQQNDSVHGTEQVGWE